MKKLVALILVIASFTLSLTSCGELYGEGACEYLDTRDVSERDVVYVEMCVERFGKMVILLDKTTAPKTVENFVNLVESGFYDGLTFHRVMENFMIQGGDPKANGQGGSSKNVVGEFAYNGYNNDIEHIKGVISMARGDNYDSASSQFFICNADARASLDGQYAAFGYVVKGLSVVDDITASTVIYTQFYGTDYQYLGNGAINDKENQAVIKYIKVLDDYQP